MLSWDVWGHYSPGLMARGQAQLNYAVLDYILPIILLNTQLLIILDPSKIALAIPCSEIRVDHSRLLRIRSTVRLSISRHNCQNTRKCDNNDFQCHRDVSYSV